MQVWIFLRQPISGAWPALTFKRILEFTAGQQSLECAPNPQLAFPRIRFVSAGFRAAGKRERS